MKFVELYHPITDGMAAYPGLESPRVGAVLDHVASRSRYEGQAEFYLGRIEMSFNTGTYIDSPFHRFPDRTDISELPLEDVAALPGVVLDGRVDDDRSVTVEAEEIELAGKAVLIRTGWDERWGTDAYWAPGPFVSSPAIELLLRAKPKLVGVDFWNIDDTIGDPGRRVHTHLLDAGILIVEHLCNLGALPSTGSGFYAAPLRIVGGASFPVRAFAEVDD